MGGKAPQKESTPTSQLCLSANRCLSLATKIKLAPVGGCRGAKPPVKNILIRSRCCEIHHDTSYLRIPLSLNLIPSQSYFYTNVCLAPKDCEE